MELSIYYGEEIVGACRFDLTRYIDVGARNEKVSMVKPGQEPKVKNQLFMKGNSQEHPEAYLIFRIFVDSIEQQSP